MYLVYSSFRSISVLKKKLLLLILYLCIWFPGITQNVSSPYSMLGIGDMEIKDYGRYFATGSASVSRRDISSYNFTNPASLTSLSFKTMNFDLAFRGRSSTFRSNDSDTATFPSNDFIVKRIALAFKVSENSGIAIGFKPYSSVGYLSMNAAKRSREDLSLASIVDGSGGINQIYASYGYKINKHLSIGITASSLFGSIKEETKYLSNISNLNLQKNKTRQYNGANILGGLQYHSLNKRKWSHLIGFTFSASTELIGVQSVEYSDLSGSLTNENEDISFKMPYSVSLGYSSILNNVFTFTAEGNYYHWSRQKLEDKRSFTGPSARLSAGIEYSKKEFTWDYRKATTGSIVSAPAMSERYYLGWGVSAENSYLYPSNKALWDFSMSFGGGLNVNRKLSLFGGIESGIKGNLKKQQIRENYVQFIMGLTVKEIWIGPKFTRQYD